MPSIFDDLNQADDSEIEGKTPPSQKLVDWFHGKASINRPEDIHHQIGFADADAASGSHTHNGKNSKFLIDASVTMLDLPASPTSAQIQASVNLINSILRGLGAS